MRDCSALQTAHALPDQLRHELFSHLASLQSATSSKRLHAARDSDSNQQIIQRIHTALHTVAAIFQNQEALDRGNPEAILQLTTENPAVLEQVSTLAQLNNLRAQRDLLNLVRSEYPRAIQLYTSLILNRVPWAQDAIGWIDQSPAILEELAHHERLLERPDIFQMFLMLAETRHNPFALEILTHEIFANPAHFNSLLQQFLSSPLIRKCCIALHTISSWPMESIPLHPDDSSAVQPLQRWMTMIPPIHDAMDRFVYLVEIPDPSFQCKVLLAHLLRQQTMVEILTKSAQPPRPAPVFSKAFPMTASWLVGISACRKHELDQSDRYLAQTLVPIGQRHGIKVAVGSQHCDLPGAQPTQEPPGDLWIQDCSAWRLERGRLVVSTPALTTHSEEQIFDVIRRSRAPDDPARRLTHAIGHVQQACDQLRVLLFAHKHRIPCTIGPAYTEEGNTLVGINAEGQPYVIVGRDTVTWMKEHVAQEMWDLGYSRVESQWIRRSPDDSLCERLSDEEVKLLLAHHYGVDPARVVLCAQADYHNDVLIHILDATTVMVNDAKLAADWMLTIMPVLAEETRQQFQRSAQLRKEIEDAAARDLTSQGFTVLRFGGNTYNPLFANPERHQINLFNFVSATTPAGKKLIVAMGCPERFQEKFRNFIAEQVGDVTIEFLDERWSEEMLSHGGGVECMVKPLTRPFFR